MTVAQNRSSTIKVKVAKGDVRTIQRGKTWAQFEHLQQGFENTRGVKLSFYNNTMEIVMPSKAHELFKKIIAILIEALVHEYLRQALTGWDTQYGFKKFASQVLISPEQCPILPCFLCQ